MMICVSPEVLRKLREADDRSDERRLGGVVGLERTERGDAALEAGVHGLQAESRPAP